MAARLRCEALWVRGYLWGWERLRYQALWVRGYLRVPRQGIGLGFLSAFVPGSSFYLRYPRTHSA